MPTNTRPNVLACAVACAAFAALAPHAAHAYTDSTVTFQRGVGGYTAESDIQFTSNYDNGPTTGDNKGATGTQLFVDGYNGTDSPDQQVFLQFNNLVGTGPGQIPANAFILDASLTLTTGTSGNSQSGGPFGVGAVLVPWNTTTSTYNNLKPAGSVEAGLNATNHIITPAVGFYDDPTVLYGGTNSLESAATAATKGTTKIKYSANVAPLVQNWVNGSVPNYGFTIHAGAPAAATTDGWQIKTGTHATVADRPLLSVHYTTAPVQTASFQEGVNGYAGTTMSWMRLETNSGTDGRNLNSAFLDGWQFNNDQDNVSSDDHALIKFNNLFQSQNGSIPDHAVILKATLVLTTSEAGNAQTGQPYQVHQMLRDWNSSTAWTDFDNYYGVRIGTDETQMLSANYGMIPDSQANFDVTSALNSWQSGAPNYGFDVRSTPPTNEWGTSDGTSDGWSIYFTGATDPTLRPQLLVSYFVHLPGDANDDGVVNADDFALTDRGFAKHLTTWADGDFNYDGKVDSADYLIIDAAFAQAHGGTLSPSFLAERQAEFGDAYVSSLIAAVPEPTSLGLLAAALPLALRRRRHA